MDEPDYMKKWRRAKQSILKEDNIWEGLIKMSAQGARDYEYLQSKDPLFVVNYFIGKMIQS